MIMMMKTAAEEMPAIRGTEKSEHDIYLFFCVMSHNHTHLSPAFFKISDLAPDRGILQSELFTSRSQNLVLAKLPNSGFWRYGQFFKWNRVKMAKNGLKMVEIFRGASHMINNNIFNIFCFLTFSFGYFLDLVFRAFFSKFGQNTGFVKYPKEKVEKQKMLKMLLLVICEVPKKISTIFKPFLAIFTLFHLTNLL